MLNPLQTISEQTAAATRLEIMPPAPNEASIDGIVPRYDRIVNIMTWGGREPDPLREFMQALPPIIINKKKPQPANMKFFGIFKPSLRRRVYSYVFEHPANGKKITLSKEFATKDVFPPDFFIVPEDLLHQVKGALSSGRQMRDELLTYFWSTYHFHVTFSPFTTGPAFSGLSVKWLNLYAERVNHLTVEIDMTKLEFSACKDAKLLKKSNDKVQKLVYNLVNALCRRKNKNVLADLTLLVRRYVGFRPAPADHPEDKHVLYCPEEAQFVFNPFRELKNIVLQCSMCGFSGVYSRDSMVAMFNKPKTKKRDIVVLPWPNYTPDPPELTYHSSFSTTDDSSTPAVSSSMSNFGYNHNMPSVGSLPSGFGYMQNAPSVGSLHSSFGYAPNRPPTGSNTPTGSFASASRSMSGTPMISNAGPFMVDENGLPTGNSSMGLGISASAATASGFLPRRGGPLDQQMPLNTKDALNKQDPAFTRSMIGLGIAEAEAGETGEAGEAGEAGETGEVEEAREAGKTGQSNSKKSKKNKKGRKH